MRYLLEGNRARVCKYASRVHEKKPQTPKKKTTAFDYSKWDHLDSDSDAETIEHTSGDNVWAAPPPNVVPPPKGDGDAAAGWPNGVEAGAAPPPKGEAAGAPGCPKGLAAAGCAPPKGLAAAALSRR